VGDQVRHRWREECIQVNLDSRYVKWSILNMFYPIVASEGRSKGRMKPKMQKMLHLSRPRISAHLWRPKRWLSRRINLHQSQGWCRSGASKIATPTKSIDPKWRREEV
jgi:hypothetical protein